MINLLPEQDKKDLVKEYTHRLWVVAGALAVIAIFIGVILLVPTYILAIYQATAANASASSSSGSDTHAALMAKVTSLQSLVSVLDPGIHPAITPTAVISTIVNDKTSENTITGFAFTFASTTLQVEISGIAQTRDSLVAFTDALKKERTIASVDLPISNLTADTNVPFTITIVAKS